MKPIETRHGPMFVLPGDFYVGRSLEVYGEFSEREQELLAQLVKPGSVVVEVGANIGAHTVPLARACAPGPLYAFEPQQRVFQLLCANLAINDIVNVVAAPEACGDAEGYALIPRIDYSRSQNFGSVALLEPDSRLPAFRVRLSPIDALGLARCRLIKVDAEGAEPAILRGARETIGRCRPILYVENGVAENQQELISLIHGFGYRQWWHTPPLFTPDNWKANPENAFGSVVSLNILAIPNELPGGPDAPPIDPANWTSPASPMRKADLAPRNAP